jgi:flavin reductase (DIM6/NTAB) family NADH-FMN oxidoreductase RutF
MSTAVKPIERVSPAAYRDALRHFPSGVTLVTIKAGDQVHGLTVSAFASVSPEPPLIAVVIDQRHRAHELLQREDAHFAVNILAQDQAPLSERFAWLEEGDRFAQGNWEMAATGAPVLADALAWLDCSIYTRYPAGTHTLLLGHVQASQVARPDEAPLVYWNRDYRQLDLDSQDVDGGKEI